MRETNVYRKINNAKLDSKSLAGEHNRSNCGKSKTTWDVRGKIIRKNAANLYREI
jgi:hypothetical protein